MDKETLKTLGVYGLIAIGSSLLATLHSVAHGRIRLTAPQLVSGALCSGLIGIITFIFADFAGVSPLVASALTAITGFTGARLLEELGDGLVGSVRILFKALIKKFIGDGGGVDDD